jgi:hypothetical protein
MASILNVDQIGHSTTGTTALTVDSSGNLSVSGKLSTPTRPIFSVRGRTNSTSLTAADANFDYISTWTTTDVNVGGLLNAGGYAQVPTGFGGIYQITWVTNSQTAGSLNFKSAFMYHYDGSTYTHLMRHFAADDYSNYSVGTTFFYQLDAGDIIYAGYDDQYAVPHADDARSNFSMMFVG